MIGRIFAIIEHREGVDLIKDVKIALWHNPPSYQEGHAVLLEIQCYDHVALWEALENAVEKHPRFAWVRGYPGITELLERRRAGKSPESFLVFPS